MTSEPTNVGIYMHFPWCVRKCPYCDFNSHPLRGNLQEDEYCRALLLDLQAQLPEIAAATIDTVFFGGGTPSLFSAKTFAAILERLAPQLAVDAEITMEANPGTLEHKPLEAYRQAGINRLSIGAQSFNPQQLAKLGRIHSDSDIEQSFASARTAGFDNVNLDLMYALPLQTVGEAITDLQRAIDLGPEHLSWYQLTLEPKTEFYSRPPPLPGEEVIGDIEAAGYRLLAEAGYSRYEVSAYARGGGRARPNHNNRSFGDYLGIGAGAHGKLSRHAGIVRTEKPKQPRLYLADPLATQTSPVARDALAEEFLLNALRLVDGVDVDLFAARTGLQPTALQPQWQRLIDRGLMRPDRLATTELGLRYLDTIVSEFLS
jgi:putative oxygen-independent coproporphyrinogen III oxidase